MSVSADDFEAVFGAARHSKLVSTGVTTRDSTMFNGWFRRISVVDLIKASNDITNPTHQSAGDISNDGDQPSEEASTPLKRVYKLTDLVYLGICNVVGSGIYVMAGSAGKDDAGAGLLISLCFGLCSAGLSALWFGMTFHP